MVAKKAVPEVVPAGDPTQGGFVITGKAYDFLNRIVRVLLPAVGTLYFALSELWDWPYGKAIVGTVAAVNLFFGSVVHVSAQNYKKQDGDVDAYIPPDSQLLQDFPGQDKVTFKVNPTLKKS